MKSWNNKFMRKMILRLKERVFLSPSYRKQISKTAIALESSIEPLWNDDVLNNNADPYRKKLTLASATIASYLAKLIKNGEEWAAQRKIINKRFTIFRHKKSQKYLIECRFFKISENKNMKAHLVFSNSIDIKGQKLGKIVRGDFSKKGYAKLDEGAFYQKFLRNFRMQYTFKGNKIRMKLKIKFTNPSYTKFILTYKPY